MNTPLQNFSDLIADIYRSALEPDRWQVVLQSLAAQMEATKASMHSHEFATNQWSKHMAGSRVQSFGYDIATAVAYAKYFAVIDPYVNRIRERFPRGGVGVSADLITPSELERTEFYTDYGRYNEIFYVLWDAVEQNERFGSGLAFIRPKDAKEFSPQHVQQIKFITPHLELAFKLQRAVQQESDNIAGMILKGVDRLNCAIVALDESSRIMNYSAPAKAILDGGEFLRIHSSRLHAVEQNQDSGLQELLTAASHAWKTPHRFTADTIRLAGKSHLQRLGLVAFPVTPALDKEPVANVLFGDRARVLLYLIDPSRVPPSRSAVLCSLYQLTATEARVADYLLKGLTIREIASKMNISEHNTRYYLKQAMEKTGTNRQALLMQLMLTLPSDLLVH